QILNAQTEARKPENIKEEDVGAAGSCQEVGLGQEWGRDGTRFWRQAVEEDKQ
nr:hypothetical protein [Tanacetum cinerariifolium]